MKKKSNFLERRKPKSQALMRDRSRDQRWGLPMMSVCANLRPLRLIIRWMSVLSIISDPPESRSASEFPNQLASQAPGIP